MWWAGIASSLVGEDWDGRNLSLCKWSSLLLIQFTSALRSRAVSCHFKNHTLSSLTYTLIRFLKRFLSFFWGGGGGGSFSLLFCFSLNLPRLKQYQTGISFIKAFLWWWDAMHVFTNFSVISPPPPSLLGKNRS